MSVADSFWNVEYLFDYAVAQAVKFISREDPNRNADATPPECTDLVQVFRERSTVDNCMLIGAGLLFGDVYLHFWLAQQPLLSLPSIMFYGSAGLAFISWESAVITDPGGIPESFAPDGNGRPRLEAEANELALVAGDSLASGSGNNRSWVFAQKEGKFKPQRAHWCKHMGRYVLRMDHWCTFMANGIGYKNHKFFYLFLLYGAMATSVETFVIMTHIWQTHPLAQILLLPGATLSGFLASLSVSTLSFHTYLLCRNMTMVEYSFPKKHHVSYDLGLRRNVAQVLGDRWWLWLSPFRGPDGTGVEWGIEQEDVPEDTQEFLQTGQSLSIDTVRNVA